MTAGVFFFVFLAIAYIITSRFQNLYFNIKLHISMLYSVCSVNIVLTLTTFEIVLLWPRGVEISVTLSFSAVPSYGVLGYFRWKRTDVAFCVVCFLSYIIVTTLLSIRRMQIS